jgi:pyruvate dehydrogenase E2 component (dihydrolipoamide acetyltransferase)
MAPGAKGHSMAEKVLMLALSPTMETGTISKWNVKEGDEISSGDTLCEVETDKATMDYESTVEGTLLKIVAGEGDEAAIGDLIAVVGEPGENIDAMLAEAEQAEKQPAPKAGAQQDEEPSPLKPEKAPAATAPAAPAPQPSAAPPSGLKSSPLARTIASDAGLDLRAITGTGPGGRVVKRDVEAAMATGGVPARASAPAVAQPAAAPGVDADIPVSQKRRIIAQRLAESKYSAPHYYLKVRVMVDELIAAREALNARMPAKVSLNAFLMKFAAEALKRHPMVNAAWRGDTIHTFGGVDIGLAVALPDGLITPIVRNCGGKGIVAIDRELKELIDKAKAGTLQPEEFTGATFTISNLGSFGVEEFTAIINPPGSAILAVGAFQRELTVDAEDAIRAATLMRLTLSCDHRVIDGVTGAAFLRDLKEMFERPPAALY